MLTRDAARRFADEWIASWNTHDLDRILSHYDEAVVLTSPLVVERLGRADGTVRGKTELRSYFERGLAAAPALRFDLENVLVCVTSVVLYYRNQRGGRTAEYMDLSPGGEVTRVVAHYD